MKVSEILNKKGSRVETVTADTGFAGVARLMTDKSIGSVVVCDSAGQVIGIVSERDVTRAISSYGPDAFSLTAATLVDDRIISCSPDDEVKRVMSIMTGKRARHVLVMVDGRLVGLISVGDVVKSRLDNCELEVNVLRDHALVRSFA